MRTKKITISAAYLSYLKNKKDKEYVEKFIKTFQHVKVSKSAYADLLRGEIYNYLEFVDNYIAEENDIYIQLECIYILEREEFDKILKKLNSFFSNFAIKLIAKFDEDFYFQIEIKKERILSYEDYCKVIDSLKVKIKGYYICRYNNLNDVINIRERMLFPKNRRHYNFTKYFSKVGRDEFLSSLHDNEYAIFIIESASGKLIEVDADFSRLL